MKRRSWQKYLLIGLIAELGLLFLFLGSGPGDGPSLDAAHANSGLTYQGGRIVYPADRQPVLTLPDGRHQTIRSVLNIQRTMRFGDYRWNDTNVPNGPVWARVDLANQTLSVFRDGHEIGSAVILYGASEKPTPIGTFNVLQKAEEYRSRTYDADMPFMLRLTADGVALHASDVQQGYATHGCIGLPPGFARKLFAQMQVGDLVAIFPASTRAGSQYGDTPNRQ